jgi:uncharacterized protein
MGVKSFFFDTYAFYEIIKGNQAYKKYKEGISLITTKLNLMELHYGLLKAGGKEIADLYYDKFLEFCIEIDDDVFKEANEFKLKNYRRELSYVDCIGYVLARKFNVRFLTGDKQFELFDNVEFVK